MSDTTVFYENDDAATFQTGIEGWVSRHGRFFGKDEHIARYDGCTHKKCDCGGTMTKHYTKCSECRQKMDNERYDTLEYREWKGEPLVSFRSDNYFFDEESVHDFLHDFDGKDPQLVICEPVHAPLIEDYGIDDLPEDFYIKDVDPKLAALIDAVNDYVEKAKPILSWVEGKYRTSVTPPKFDDE